MDENLMGNAVHAHSSLLQTQIHPPPNSLFPQNCPSTNQQDAVQHQLLVACFQAEEFLLHLSLLDCVVKYGVNA